MRRTLALLRKTTGIAGLPIHPNPRPALIRLYQDTLSELQSMPQDAAYTKAVKAITEQRLSIVEAEQSRESIQTKLGAGVIEEVLVQAEDELSLLKKMKVWKPWEQLEVKPADNQWTYFK